MLYNCYILSLMLETFLWTLFDKEWTKVQHGLHLQTCRVSFIVLNKLKPSAHTYMPVFLVHVNACFGFKWTRAAMSNSIFAFATFIWNSEIISIMSNTPKFFDKFYILGHLFSNSLGVFKWELNEKVFFLCFFPK